MSIYSRRQFLASSTAAAAAASVAGQMVVAAEGEKRPPMRLKSPTDIVELGATGIKTTVLGAGFGIRGGTVHRALGAEGVGKILKAAYDRGLRYIDTADAYKTHPLLAPTIKELPRDKLFILTKTGAKTAEKAKEDLERFRQELGIETLDLVLMHCMRKKGWPEDMRPVRDVLLDAKRKGQIRAVGVSCHGWDPLVDAVDCPDIDAHLVRINHKGTMMDSDPDPVAKEMAKMYQKGRGMIGMKIFGEGAFKTPEERLASMKYVLGLGTLHCFTIGFASVEELDDTLETFKKAVA